MLKKLANYIGWVVLATVLAISASYLVTSRTVASPQPAQSSAAANAATTNVAATKPLKPLTYFLTMEESLHNLDGSKIMHQGQEGAWEIVYGQRADGARVHMMWPKSAPQHATRNVAFPDKGITVDLNRVNDNKTTWGRGVPQDVMREIRLTDYVTCGTGTLPEKETIQGFKVIHTVRKIDQDVRESWKAPAFDCREIKLIYTTPASRTIIEPIVLSDKAPDDSYFAIKDGLKEVDPSTFRQSMSDKPTQPAGKNQIQAYESEKAERIKGQ